MSVKKELNHKLYIQREENIKHLDFQKEFAFYNAIAAGNKKEILACRERFVKAFSDTENPERNGTLSNNPVQNERYHFVVMAAMIARVCVQAGLNHETAYSLSDIYIQKMDECSDIESINELRNEMVFGYAEHMQSLRKQNVYSKHIVKCIDFIYDKLNTNLNVTTIADYLDINPTYLSKLFVKETGMTLSRYIKEEKLRASASMLQFSDNSIGEISEYFCFSSQSHFTNAFQEEYGITPKKFRDIHSKKAIVVL